MDRAVPVMEVWFSGFAVQAGVPNHRKLRRLRAGVVSVAAKGLPCAGQVSGEKTNGCEPLLTHRQTERWHRNRGGAEFPGQRRADVVCPQPGGGLHAALVVPGVEVA